MSIRQELRHTIFDRQIMSYLPVVETKHDQTAYGSIKTPSGFTGLQAEVYRIAEPTGLDSPWIKLGGDLYTGTILSYTGVGQIIDWQFDPKDVGITGAQHGQHYGISFDTDGSTSIQYSPDIIVSIVDVFEDYGLEPVPDEYNIWQGPQGATGSSFSTKLAIVNGTVTINILGWEDIDQCGVYIVRDGSPSYLGIYNVPHQTIDDQEVYTFSYQYLVTLPVASNAYIQFVPLYPNDDVPPINSYNFSIVDVITDNIGVTGQQGVTGLQGIAPYGLYDAGTFGSTGAIINFNNGFYQKIIMGSGGETGFFYVSGGYPGSNYVIEVSFDQNIVPIGYTGIKWPAGTPPTLSGYTGSQDLISIYTNGNAYYGAISLSYMY